MTYGEPLVGWDNNLLTYVDPAVGGLTTVNWVASQGNWTVAAPRLTGSPDGLLDAGFSAVAETQAMKIYVFSPSRGEIHQYGTNITDAYEWVWEDKVAFPA